MPAHQIHSTGPNLALHKASLNGHNFSSVGPITLILSFSGCLERGLSDDVEINSHLRKSLNLDHQNSSYKTDSSTFKMKGTIIIMLLRVAHELVGIISGSACVHNCWGE